MSPQPEMDAEALAATALATPPALVRRRRPPRVLVVDDHPGRREAYSAHLRHAGFDVLAAADGLEALARVVARRPDAIVMDLAMPRVDGWEVTRRLKAAAATRDIPIIAVTGHDPLRSRARALAAGCAACLHKPCPPEALRAEVQRQIDIHRPRPRRRGRAGRV